MNTATATAIKEFFTSDEWDMIYNFIGNALDHDDENPETVYAIRKKIYSIFGDDD